MVGSLLHAARATHPYIVHAVGMVSKEAIWLHELLTDLRIDIKGSIEILEDNQSAIAMEKNSIGHM